MSTGPTLESATRLEGKVALVTGATQNIGRAIATELARGGADVVVVARTADDLTRTAEAIEATSGRQVHTITADLEHDAVRVADEARAATGGVDILVNNVAGGTTGPLDSLIDVSDEILRSSVTLNLLVPLELTRRLCPSMRRRPGAAILNVVSTSAFSVVHGRGAYGVTKAALWTMTKYLARELAPDIRVNALCPGTVSEDGAARGRAVTWESLLPAIPMQRFGKATETAQAARFLVSPAASYTTGQCLFVDGGRVFQ